MRKNDIENLNQAIMLSGVSKPISDLPWALKLVIWELMKAITRLNKLEKKLKGKK